MEQPPTHYQLSFTARQGLLLFVGFLLALGLAYFFGLMTGLSGRPSQSGAISEASTPVPAGGASPLAPPAPATPAASRGEAPKGRPHEASRFAAAESTAPAELQLFDDAGEPTPEPSRRVLATAATPAPSSAGGEFWVQVLSVSSEHEAKARSARLARHHYHAAVVAASTGRGKVYRVRVGPYRSREEADRAAVLLKSRENVEPWIVPAGQ